MEQTLTSIQFLRKLQECLKEYRKQMNDTRDESDAAHFFNPALKNLIKQHREEMNALSLMNFDKSFMSFVKNYLLKEKKDT